MYNNVYEYTSYKIVKCCLRFKYGSQVVNIGFCIEEVVAFKNVFAERFNHLVINRCKMQDGPLYIP